jgi:ribose transport system permease protein
VRPIVPGTLRNLSRVHLGLDRFSGLYLAGLFILVFGLWTPQLFLTTATIHSVAASQAITAMAGIAVLIPLVAGVFDLSVGATMNLSTVLVSLLQSGNHWGMWPAIFLSIGCAAVVGLLNGFVVVVLRVDSFIATLGMATVVAAVQEIVTGESQPLPANSSSWLNLTSTSVLGFQIVFFYMIVLAFLAWWYLDHTPAGRYFYAIGGNRDAARLAGIRVGLWTWVSLLISGLLAGIGGVFYASYNGPSLTYGSSMLLPAFAAAFLGSTQLKPGRFNIWGTIIAIYTLAIGVRGLQLVTGAQWLSDMFNGVALIVAVAFAVWRQGGVSHLRRKGNRPASEAEQEPGAAEPEGAGTRRPM